MALPQHKAHHEAQGAAAAVDWRSLYEIEDPSTVERYVDRYDFLIPLLSRAPAAIREHFGDHEGLRLEVIADPDAEGAEHLYLYVCAKGEYSEIRRRRDHLDDSWWIDAMLDARAQMTVDVEFA